MSEARQEPSILASTGIRPAREEKVAPCCAGCASGTDVRGWIAIIAQRHKLGLSLEEAYVQAWERVTAVNPFPATMGRICPHPCQTNCSRAEKDGAVEINALERFLGDWGLARGLGLPRLAPPGSRVESIGVVGSGPAGLSFGYQMARRGYRVTIYEKEDKPGGMLYYGIPQYRLPEGVLEAEVQRILDLGVRLRLGTAIGRDLPFPEVRKAHQALFLGIGAGQALTLDVPGEAGGGVWTGTEYLARVNSGEPVALGDHVIVVGGGNSAVDAARVARRSGADVTMLYRRTRTEMPAIEHEVDAALAEGVRIEFLTVPTAIIRRDGTVSGVVVRRMRLGEPDASGRRRPMPLPGTESELRATAVIAAVSQQPDWSGLGNLAPEGPWANETPSGWLGHGLWTGGDTFGLGIASRAIGQGRQAAEALDARLQGTTRDVRESPATPPLAVKPDFYEDQAPVEPPRLPAETWRLRPEAELTRTLAEEDFLREVGRCFSCGQCYGCEQCFMYCNAGGFTRLAQVGPGTYFGLDLALCQACGKCADLCPCGFITPTQGPPS